MGILLQSFSLSKLSIRQTVRWMPLHLQSRILCYLGVAVARYFNSPYRSIKGIDNHITFTGWLMAVQAFMTLGLIFSCLAQITATLLLTRWPLNFVFRYQWQLLGLCGVFNAAKTFSLFLAVAVFGGQCWRRDWLLYPNFNYLSWSYAFAVISMAFAGLSTACFYFVSEL